MNPDLAQPSEPPDDSPEPTSRDVDSPGSPAAPPTDPLTAEVLAQLEQTPAQRTWVQTLLLLGLSLFIFSASGLLSSTLPELLLLVGVLLLHETGHYVGMRLF